MLSAPLVGTDLFTVKPAAARKFLLASKLPFYPIQNPLFRNIVHAAKIFFLQLKAMPSFSAGLVLNRKYR
jgi:hypothetical protein